MMAEFATSHNKLAVIIATKDRPQELRRVLKSLGIQSRKPDQVIVVDGGSNRVDAEVGRFPELKPVYLRAPKPSAAGQRNLGLSAVADGCEFIGFLDDDVILDPRAIEVMMAFWDGASDRIVGAGLNLANHPPLDWPFLKTSRLAEILGLYSSKKGAVTRSGFQTMIGPVQVVTHSDWLPTTAVVWRKRVFESYRFDDWFDGYSYLEDLDFSYRVGKSYQLFVIPGSIYSHFPAAHGRGSGFVFGRREVRNRLHFVRKNPELSVARCVSALWLRTLLNLGLAVRKMNAYHFQRFIGNLTSLAKAAISRE